MVIAVEMVLCCRLVDSPILCVSGYFVFPNVPYSIESISDDTNAVAIVVVVVIVVVVAGSFFTHAAPFAVYDIGNNKTPAAVLYQIQTGQSAVYSFVFVCMMCALCSGVVEQYIFDFPWLYTQTFCQRWPICNSERNSNGNCNDAI